MCSSAIMFYRRGVSNNHILDYGTTGLADTIHACRSIGLSVTGAGMNLKQAQQPFVKDVGGIIVSIIALAEQEFNQAQTEMPGSAPLEPIENYKQIKEAREQSDVVIVTIHGGNEYFPYPRPGLRKICHFFIDLGVEAVICHHAHIPGAYEIYNDKPIIFSTGNFFFDSESRLKDWKWGIWYAY